jgi:hypothetical protein
MGQAEEVSEVVVQDYEVLGCEAEEVDAKVLGHGVVPIGDVIAVDACWPRMEMADHLVERPEATSTQDPDGG